jgi:hypothetical protein
MKKLNLNMLMILSLVLSVSIFSVSCESDDDVTPPVVEPDPDPDPDPVFGETFSADADDWTTSIQQGEQSTGADLSVFGWTYTASQAAADIEGLEYDNPSWTIADPQEPMIHSGFIEEDETWTNDRFHILDGKVYVTEGVTLTVEAGTIIKGRQSSGANASALIIAQDATAIMQGTAEQPIIMTAESDDIQLGTNAGTELDITDSALWGGLIVLGNTVGSFSGDATSIQIEGLPATEPGDYGGTDNNDSSGVYEYISIRHGGAVIGSDNEINGFTLGAVGSGTTMNHIEVVANLDDGIEWFAGTVNASNLVVWGCGDDQLDIDEAYSGTITNALTVSTNVSDHALEIDGPAGSFQAGFTIDGLTMIGNTDPTNDASGNREYVDLRDGALCTIKNVYAYGFLSGSDVELDDEDSAKNYQEGNISFENWQIVYPEGDDNTVMWNNTTLD